MTTATINGWSCPLPLRDYPNIIMGRDAKFYLPLFFKVESLPAIYVYDKKGNFKQAFSGSVKMDKIAAAL